MAENYAGKRVKQGGKGPLIALIACACVIVLALGGYLGLCAWAGGHILPNSEAAGVELGGLSYEAAAEKLAQAQQRYQGKAVALAYEQTRILCELDRAGVAFDTDGIIKQLSGGGEGFLTRGASWLGALLDGDTHEALGALVFEDQSYLDGLMNEVTSALTQPVKQHEAQLAEDYILFTRGQAGMAVDAQTLESELLERLAENNLDDLAVEPQITEPDEPDFESLSQALHTEPSDAFLSPETFEITPSVNGVDLDPATAQAMYERMAPGESCQIPLQVTEPEITTETLTASLFNDLLGEAKSTVGGTENRAANVSLAASFCNDVILLPGEVFSYWDAIAPCSAAQGFKPAPSYLNGMTVDTIGGGVCQVSSSIYYASLLSNLEIVQRRNHSFAVGYLPDGADATVSGGNPDFQFKNNTPYPIKITASMSGRSLTVQIWGTKVDDTYVKMEFVRLSTTNPETVYKIDDSVPVGTTQTEVTAYTGRKVEAYRCIYDGNDKLISRTLESTNNYQKRDQVILVNSADAYKYGLGEPPAAAEPSTAPDPTVPPEEPVTSPDPVVTDPEPIVSFEPVTSPEPSVTLDPAETPPAEETPNPDAPIPVLPIPELTDSEL